MFALKYSDQQIFWKNWVLYPKTKLKLMRVQLLLLDMVVIGLTELSE
jgi:hypothetical protein